MSKRLERIDNLVSPHGRLGFSRATLYRMIKEGKFPAPLRIGERMSAWPSEVVDAWIEARKRVSDVML